MSDTVEPVKQPGERLTLNPFSYQKHQERMGIVNLHSLDVLKVNDKYFISLDKFPLKGIRCFSVSTVENKTILKLELEIKETI